MDIHSRTAEAKVTMGNPYPVPGVYPLVQVEVLKEFTNRKSEPCIAAELAILESDVEARPAGSKMDYVINFKFDAAPGNWKALLAALADLPVEQIDEDGSRAAVSSANPFKGRLLRLEAATIITKENKKEFTKCNWFSIPEATQAKAAELRKKIGFMDL